MYENSFEWGLDGLVDINNLFKEESLDLDYFIDLFNSNLINTEKFTRYKSLNVPYEFTTSK